MATVGGASKGDFLVAHAGLAPEQIVVRDRRRFGEQLDHALEAQRLDGFDVVLDGIAGPYFMPAYKRLRPEGRMIVLGASYMMPSGRRTSRLLLAPRYLRRPRLDPLRMMSSNPSVAGLNLIWLWGQQARLGALYDRVSDVLKEPPHVGRLFPFSAAPDALRWMMSGESVGSR